MSTVYGRVDSAGSEQLYEVREEQKDYGQNTTTEIDRRQTTKICFVAPFAFLPPKDLE
jgi:hypothetical protein